jgi:hypothetical protein
MQRYEITVELPNGDWHWIIGNYADYHAMIEDALAYAGTFGHEARVHHVERCSAFVPL